MNLKNYHKKFKAKLDDYPLKWAKEQRILHLVEEVGEFAGIVLQYQGYKKPSKTKEDIKNALADILEDILALAMLYRINFKELLNEAIKYEKK